MDGIDCLAPVADLASKLSTQRTIAGACNDVLQAGMSITAARCGEVLFRETETRTVICLASQGPFPWCASQSGGRRLGSRLVEATLHDHLPLYSEDVAHDERLAFHLLDDAELSRAISVPLIVRGRALGAINLCGAAAAEVDDETKASLQVLAALLAPVIENLYLSERATSKELERRQFLVRELEASEDERQRIARELHDGLGQTLTGLVVNIDGALATLSPRGRDRPAFESLQRSREAAATALQDIRRVILALRPTVLDDMGLFAALEAYARRILGDAGIDVRLRVSGSAEGLGAAVENVVFRVVQEAINNVARHSGASTCRLALSNTPAALFAAVEDDGIGFDPEAEDSGGGHFGLKNMRERIELVGGSFSVSSAPGSSRVELRIPRRPRRARAPSRRPR